MNKIISILLLACLALSMVRFSVPYLWYYSNYEYISQQLCENRDKPHLECNGFCQLKKKVHEHHDEKEKEAKPVIHKQTIHLFLVNDFLTEVVPPKAEKPNLVYTHLSESIWSAEPVSPPPRK